MLSTVDGQFLQFQTVGGYPNLLYPFLTVRKVFQIHFLSYRENTGKIKLNYFSKNSFFFLFFCNLPQLKMDPFA